MGKCALSIVLDKPEHTYRPGETISGRVEVLVTAECKCDGLDVAFAYHTHGKGNKNTKRLGSQRLFEGTWAAGEYAYPFRIVAPESPLPYQGTLLNIEHRLEVTADIPWAIDPKEMLPVVLKPDAVQGLEIKWSESALSGGTGNGCLMTSVLLLGLGLATVGSAFVSHEDDLLSVGAPLLLFGLIGLVISLPKILAVRKLGSVRMALRRGGAGSYRDSGDDGVLHVAIHTRSGDAVADTRATLKIMEQVVRGSGSNKRTYTHMLHEDEVRLKNDGNGVFRGRLRLPEAGRFPYSFNAHSNKILWTLDGHVDIPGWPDWKHKVQLTAVPETVR